MLIKKVKQYDILLNSNLRNLEFNKFNNAILIDRILIFDNINF